ncbi:MAG: hypothetical protein ABNH38_11355 [Tateyamaria sp.]
MGERHGKPVVLKVAAGRMHSNGFEFFRADNSVWLLPQHCRGAADPAYPFEPNSFEMPP